MKSHKATYLCSQIKLALNMQDQKKIARVNCDCVMIKGGNIRAEADYDKHNFTLEGLNSEMMGDEGINRSCGDEIRARFP